MLYKLTPRQLFPRTPPRTPWPIDLAMKLGFDDTPYDTIEVYDSTTNMTFGEAVWWDDRWELADGSLPHHHWSVELIFQFSDNCHVYDDDETDSEDDEDSDGDNTLRVLRIDIAGVPVIM